MIKWINLLNVSFNKSITTTLNIYIIILYVYMHILVFLYPV
jgi:hypothetical protein